MTRIGLRTALALRRRRRAAWTPWKRTQVIEWTIGIACVLLAAISLVRGIM